MCSITVRLIFPVGWWNQVRQDEIDILVPKTKNTTVS